MTTPVRIPFSVEGYAEVISAIKSVSQVLKEAQSQRVQESKSIAKVIVAEEKQVAKQRATEAKKAIKEQEEVEKFIRKAQENTSKFLFGEWKRRQKESERFAKEQVKIAERSAKEQQRAFERAQKEQQRAHSLGAQNWSSLGQNVGLGKLQSYGAMGGTFALAMLGVDLIKTALSLAAEALKQFAGFVLNDIIKPGLKLGTQSMQIGNVVGASRGAVRGTVLALSGQYGSVDSETVSETLAIAAGHTKDLNQAKGVASTALKISQIFGQLSPTELAEMLGRRRANMPGLSDEEFEGFSTLQMRKFLSKDSGLNPKTLLEMRGQLEGFSERFGGNDKARAHSMIGISGLLGYGAKHGFKSGEEAGSALEQLFNDLQKHASKYAVRAGTSELIPLNQSLPTLVKTYQGKIHMMQQAGLSEGTIKAVLNLKLDTVYRNSEAQKAGSGAEAVQKHLEKIMMPSGEEDFSKEFVRSQKDAAIQMQEVINRIKSSLMEKFLPIVEEKLIPAFERAEPQLVKFIDALTKVAQSMNVDLASIFGSIAKGIGSIMYHILNLMNRFGMVNMSDKELEGLRKIISGANHTTTAAFNTPSNLVEGFYNTIPLGKYLKWAPHALMQRGMAAAYKWIAGGDDNQEEENAARNRAMMTPTAPEAPLLSENVLQNGQAGMLANSIDSLNDTLKTHATMYTADRHLPIANRSPIQ